MPVGPSSVERLHTVLDEIGWTRLQDGLRKAVDTLEGRTVWVVNSTSVGGGVTELIRSWTPYWRGAAIDQRWVVISGGASFFRVTKRIHNFLHGHPGDGGELALRERRIYDRELRANAVRLASALRPGDVVILHDPQTAGMLPALKASGALVVWRSHVGADRANSFTAAAWEFLSPYLRDADGFVFSRRPDIPLPLRGAPVRVIAPCIDPASTKNRYIDLANARSILAHAGIARPAGRAAPPVYECHDGTPRHLMHQATVLREGQPPRIGTDRIVLHLSRWDRLKDPIGVLDSFTDHVVDAVDAHLVLAGPAAHAVLDDPEAEAVYDEVAERWGKLPPRVRARIDLVRLPFDDGCDNAAIVNALQGLAEVVVKKSLEEGFGLGVTEAMWKQRPVVASAVGGHLDQIQDGISGVLVRDPQDQAKFGRAIVNLLSDPARAERLRKAGRQHVRERYLPDRHTARWAALLRTVIEPA